MKTAGIMIFAGLFFVGSSASADTTAVYKAKSKANPFTMTVEIADDGNVRYQMSAGRTYGLVVGGTDYFVELGPKGPVVDRADDLIAAQKEAMAALMPKFGTNASTSPQLVPIGQVMINGRAGQAFGYKTKDKSKFDGSGFLFNDDPKLDGKTTARKLTESEAKRLLADPVVVISHNSDLAQLGKAMAEQFGTSLSMFTRMTGDAPSTFVQMEGLLQTGAPLSFGGMELQSVNHEPIDPKRFELPAQPETLDQIRERMKPLAPPPSASAAKP